MPSAVKPIFFAFFLLVLAVWPVSAQFTSAGWVTVPADTGFPMYPIIMPNIRFWEKIYGAYREDQGVLHDRDNLDVIYGVINFVSKDTPGAAKINEKLIDFSRRSYKNMLIKFAAGGKPENKEEQRIHLLFARRTPEVFRKASENIRLQTGLQRHFRDGVIRSGAYMPMIKRVLRQHGLPEELAYLPHVESSFNPKAYSKAGAAGLWQFTRSTGRDFMTINELVDERYDPHVATEAAARFLKGNHRHLGSWPLALTAYNHGRAGMLRAKEQWGSYPAIFARHSSATFGFASRNFYAEFVAAYRTAKRLEADHSVIRDRPWASATLLLKGHASVKDMLRYFGISAEEFRRLNPALRKPVLEGQKYIPKGVELHLPATRFIRDRIRTMPDNLLHSSQLADSRPETRSAGSQTYTVRRGDTALGIARRFGITLDTLRRLNRLNKNADVRIGQRLTVPGSKGSSSSRRMIKSKAKRKP
jgi:membrane-bound lytic murein transglycosylase D